MEQKRYTYCIYILYYIYIYVERERVLINYSANTERGQYPSNVFLGRRVDGTIHSIGRSPLQLAYNVILPIISITRNLLHSEDRIRYSKKNCNGDCRYESRYWDTNVINKYN